MRCAARTVSSNGAERNYGLGSMDRVEPPTDVGEPGVSPIRSAVANVWRRQTGDEFSIALWQLRLGEVHPASGD